MSASRPVAAGLQVAHGVPHERLKVAPGKNDGALHQDHHAHVLADFVELAGVPGVVGDEGIDATKSGDRGRIRRLLLVGPGLVHGVLGDAVDLDEMRVGREVVLAVVGVVIHRSQNVLVGHVQDGPLHQARHRRLRDEGAHGTRVTRHAGVGRHRGRRHLGGRRSRSVAASTVSATRECECQERSRDSGAGDTTERTHRSVFQSTWWCVL